MTNNIPKITKNSASKMDMFQYFPLLILIIKRKIILVGMPLIVEMLVMIVYVQVGQLHIVISHAIH